MSGSSTVAGGDLATFVHCGKKAEAQVDRWTALRQRCGAASPSLRHEWLKILREGLSHTPYCLEVRQGEETVGLLPLCFMHTRLFGKFLVGLPYLNVGGVLTEDLRAAHQLLDRAIALADDLNVRYLELRHEHRWPHPALNYESTTKVHMRLDLPANDDSLWEALSAKVRNQVRKAEKNGLTVDWGGQELLDEFYEVFSINMRDLGTPVFGRGLFRAILTGLENDAEICVVRGGPVAVASSIVLFGQGVAEVPSASSLRQHNHLNGNMLMYWHMLRRSIQRKQQVFDFGRSTAGSNTYRFKEQWGAQPQPAIWQYYVRQGSVGDMRPDNPKQQRRIAVWRRLPVWITRLLGPHIVRGIP